MEGCCAPITAGKDDDVDDGTHSKVAYRRISAFLLPFTALSIVVLFLAHPGGHAIDFAGFLADEADHQLAAAIVHGGFVAILGIQVALYVIFSRRLGFDREAVTAATVFFGLGALFQMAAIFTDGVVVPAFAAHVLHGPKESIEASRSLFALCQTVSSYFGILGGSFESVGITCWGTALFSVSRPGAIAALVIGTTMATALVASVAIDPEYQLLSILGLIFWPLIVSTLMFLRTI